VAGEVIDVPAERLPPPPVSGQPRLQVPLGAAHVEVNARAEAESAQSPDPDRTVARQIEHRHIDPAAHGDIVHDSAGRTIANPSAFRVRPVPGGGCVTDLSGDALAVY